MKLSKLTKSLVVVVTIAVLAMLGGSALGQEKGQEGWYDVE